MLGNFELITTESRNLEKEEKMSSKVKRLHNKRLTLTQGLIPPDPSPNNSSPIIVKVFAGKLNIGIAPTVIITLPTA